MVLKIWYIPASTIAFVTSVLFGFFIQKMWTFKEKMDPETEHLKLIKFYTLAFINATINAYLIYFFVEKVTFGKIESAIISSILISTYSFFLYKKFIFKDNKF